MGFGAGEHLLAQARSQPNIGFLGAEVYQDGLANCLHQLTKNPTNNLRLFHGDGQQLLNALPPNSLSAAYILFPDPWPKYKHHKRRLIQPPFLNLLATKMQPAARLRFASDEPSYQASALAHILAHPNFHWFAPDHPHPATLWQKTENTTTTRYQAKAEKAGRKSLILDFLKR
ncbi:MAG: tRNA (guanine(46)-N(7))-methyltransferase TrmB [Alphaproteobacteria bacterium]